MNALTGTHAARVGGAGISIVAAVVAALAFPAGAQVSAGAPPERLSPPGEIVVVTVNALQNTTDIERIDELASAVRSRIMTSDGTYLAPDVIVANEMNTTESLLAFKDALDARFDTSSYDIAGSTDPTVKAKFFVNGTTMETELSSTWPDVCVDDVQYQFVRLREIQSRRLVSTGGVHFRVNYGSGAGDCKAKNAREAREQMDGEVRSIVGDFNRRAMQQALECDPEETSGDMEWYSTMTTASPYDGRSYQDGVRHHHRAHGLTMAREWTHERAQPSELCDGSVDYKRSRIDYLFVSDNVGVGEAHADHPGWADEDQRGVIACEPAPSCKYSDHRLVWGRFVIGDPSEPSPSPSPTHS